MMPKRLPLPQLLERDPNKTKIVFVRHGLTDWNVMHRLQGTTDTSLNKVGETQCRTLAQQLKAIYGSDAFDVILSSPLKRAVESANLIAAGLDKEQVIIVDGLKEWNAGCLQGKTLQELEETEPELFRQWIWRCDPTNDFRGGESLKARFDRASKVLEEIAQSYRGQTVLCVTHGGMLVDFFRRCCARDVSEVIKIPRENAGLHVIEYTFGLTFQVLFWAGHDVDLLARQPVVKSDPNVAALDYA